MRGDQRKGLRERHARRRRKRHCGCNLYICIFERLRKFLPSRAPFITGGGCDVDGYRYNSRGLYANVLLPVCVGENCIVVISETPEQLREMPPPPPPGKRPHRLSGVLEGFTFLLQSGREKKKGWCDIMPQAHSKRPRPERFN